MLFFFLFLFSFFNVLFHFFYPFNKLIHLSYFIIIQKLYSRKYDSNHSMLNKKINEDKIKTINFDYLSSLNFSYQIALNHSLYIIIFNFLHYIYQFLLSYENKVFNILNNEPTKSKKSPLIIYPHLHKMYLHRLIYASAFSVFTKSEAIPS